MWTWVKKWHWGATGFAVSNCAGQRLPKYYCILPLGSKYTICRVCTVKSAEKLVLHSLFYEQKRDLKFWFQLKSYYILVPVVPVPFSIRSFSQHVYSPISISESIKKNSPWNTNKCWVLFTLRNIESIRARFPWSWVENDDKLNAIIFI